MKTYWNIALVCCLLLALLGFVAPAFLGGFVVVLGCAWCGPRLARHIPMLRHQRPGLAASLLVAGCSLVGVGAAFHLTPVWLTGLALVMALMFAVMAHDIETIDGKGTPT